MGMLLEGTNSVIYGGGGAIGAAVARAYGLRGGEDYPRRLRPRKVRDAAAEETRTEREVVARKARVDTFDDL
jgi:NAD(P)-dependent dehydrogenase (short-subunit alcohol dehydrogenase family)